MTGELRKLRFVCFKARDNLRVMNIWLRIIVISFVLGSAVGVLSYNASPEHYAYRGYKCLFQEKKAKAAIADFSQAIVLKPNCASYYCGRAIAYLKIGNIKNALEDLRNALVLDPALPLAYNVRANAHKALGDESNAMKDFNTCLSLYRITDGYEEGCLLETVLRTNDASGFNVGLVIPFNDALLDSQLFGITSSENGKNRLGLHLRTASTNFDS